MTTPSQKVSIYSVNDLKNATDDALAPYLTALPKPYNFKQQNFKTDVRLAVGYSAAILAGLLFYADYKLGWDVTKPYTAPACVAYMLMNGFLTYWIWMVEAGTVFSGVREGGQKLTLKSSTQKYKPIYKLKVRYEAPITGKVWEDKIIEGTFMEWFDVNGHLQQKELRSWLIRNIDVLRLADSESRPAQEKVYEEAVKDVSANAVTQPPTVGTVVEPPQTPSSAKGKKSRKKA